MFFNKYKVNEIYRYTHFIRYTDMYLVCRIAPSTIQHKHYDISKLKFQ